MVYVNFDHGAVFIQQCLAEPKGRVDTEVFLEALEYVRDDGRSNR